MKWEIKFSIFSLSATTQNTYTREIVTHTVNRKTVDGAKRYAATLSKQDRVLKHYIRSKTNWSHVNDDTYVRTHTHTDPYFYYVAIITLRRITP